jgi:uncharacterized RmlC-like cupin family protein
VTDAVRCFPGGRLPPDVASRWAGAGLAELTHAPSGYSDLAMELLELAPAAAGPAHHHGPVESLLVVLAGELTLESGAGLRHTVRATTGDVLAIAATVVHRERNPDPAMPTRYAVYLASGGTFPVPG